MTIGRSVLRLLLLGGGIGLPVLGVGGRLAMRAVATANGTAPILTPEGTLTVLLSGVAAGIAGAVVYGLLAWKVRRASIRLVLFGAFLIFITSRGLHPVELRPALLFGPLVALYGGMLVWLWPRVMVRAISPVSLRV